MEIFQVFSLSIWLHLRMYMCVYWHMAHIFYCESIEKFTTTYKSLSTWLINLKHPLSKFQKFIKILNFVFPILLATLTAIAYEKLNVMYAVIHLLTIIIHNHNCTYICKFNFNQISDEATCVCI